MSSKFIRVYKKLDINEVESHLMVCGDLAANCGKCKAMGIKFDMPKCPECQVEFKYITFRNIKENMPKLQKIHESSSHLTIIDYDDFKRLSGALKAEQFLK